MSINYLHHVEQQANVQWSGEGEENLNEFGKTFYADGANPYFGIVCGD